MSDVANGRLLVVGAGQMGAQIAVQSAMNGVDVELVDVVPEALERGRAQIVAILDRNVEKDRSTRVDADASLARIHFSSDLAAAAPRCDWAIEAVVERLDVKKIVFAQLAELLPAHAGIATNSSHIRAESIAGDAPYSDRVLNMHFFHPLTVMDLVEIVAAPHTSSQIMDAAVAWAARIKRTSVVLNKAVDGFLVNRVLGAASREAFALLADGVASFPEIDIAVKRGLRWPLGPFALADLSGLDLLLQSRTTRFEKHGEAGDKATMDIVGPLVAAGRLGRKSGAGFYDYSVDPPAPLPLPSPGAQS
ncbi:MAG: 3-hydroxyacyl-CoA dehydrogenase [Microbacteriaceae bacterium]|nr:3-hydroxyacyl-CoA dehydrogenase [Microbacteriaceae bacterium]